MYLKELYLLNKMIKSSEKVEKTGTYIIYKQEHSFKESTILIEVTDSKLQSQLYEVFKSVISTQPLVEFSGGGLAVEITNLYVQFKKVKCFTCKVIRRFRNCNAQLKSLDSIVIRLEFAESMFEKGYKLNEKLFHPLNFNMNTVQFLVCFEKAKNKEEIEKSRALLIQYLHYASMQGKTNDFFEFYKNFDESGPTYWSISLPYDYNIVKICYNYYKHKIVTNDFDKKIKGQDRKVFVPLCAFVMKERLEKEETDDLKLKEENDEYIIYSNGYKIFKSANSDFHIFLKKFFEHNGTSPINDVIHLLADFNTGQYIGYKIGVGNTQKWNSVLNFPINSQRELFDYIGEIFRYCENCNSRFEKDYELNNVEECILDVEKKLHVTGSNFNNLWFSVPDVEDLYKLQKAEPNLLKQQITKIFFKLFYKYITEKYGQLSDKRAYLSKIEIRYLPPKLVHEFVQYCLGSGFDIGIATEELIKFVKYTACAFDKNTMKDQRFRVIDAIKDIVFDYELEVELDKNATLPDGRRLVVFSEYISIPSFMQRAKKLRDNIKDKLGKIQDSNVQFIESVTLVINTQCLNQDDFYNVCGYIANSKATQMSLDTLMALNNRDLLKVVGYLFTKFQKNYIELEDIWMTDEFEFYIDYLNPKFQIYTFSNCDVILDYGFINPVVKAVKRADLNQEKQYTLAYIEKVYRELFNKGYNPAGLHFDVENLSEKAIISFANEMDAYCDEHRIFFKSANAYCSICKKFKANLNIVTTQLSTLVFEDSNAKHYRFKDGSSIFKRYKNITGIEQVEANIDKVFTDFVFDKLKKTSVTYLQYSSYSLNNSPLNNKIELFQDCFRPRKKVLDDNNRFVGYIYDNVSFSTDGANAPELCMDLTDTKLLKNLPRLKSLIRLVIQVKEMMAQDYGFVKNPFPHVFLNTAHKKQVQILNVDFVTYGIDKKDTEKWTYDYVCSVLQSDTSIVVDWNNIGADLDSLLNQLNEISSTLTKRCSIHQNYYQNHFKFCPECIKPGTEITEVKVHREADFGTKFQQISEGEGGEAIVYSYKKGTVIKIFKPNINYDLKMVVLHRLLGKKQALKKINSQNHKFKFIYPMKLVQKADENVVMGYIMEKVENAYPISILRDKAEIEKLKFSQQDIFEILITVGEGIEALHKKSIFIGDLNGRNILFDKNKKVYFIDSDGMGVDEISPEFCTDEYIDPVSKKNQNITKNDDWYSFAVQAFYYLTYTHPFNGIYYEEKNGKKVKLDVIEKMERGISLLGKHGVKPPKIACSWDWMTSELKSAFLNVFEGQLRESLVPYLRNQYKTLFSKDEM